MSNFVCPTPVTFNVNTTAPFAVEAGTEYFVISDVAFWYKLGTIGEGEGVVVATAENAASGYWPANEPFPLATGSNTFLDIVKYSGTGHGSISKAKRQS